MPWVPCPIYRAATGELSQQSLGHLMDFLKKKKKKKKVVAIPKCPLVAEGTWIGAGVRASGEFGRLECQPY